MKKSIFIILIILSFNIAKSQTTERYAVVWFETNAAYSCSEYKLSRLISKPILVPSEGNRNSIKLSLETQFLNWLYENNNEKFNLLKESTTNSRATVLLGDTEEDVKAKVKNYGAYSRDTSLCQEKYDVYVIEKFENFIPTENVNSIIKYKKQEMLRKFIAIQQ